MGVAAVYGAIVAWLAWHGQANFGDLISVVVGVLFVITACAYGVMSVKEMRSGEWITTPDQLATASSETPSSVNDKQFNEFMDEYGVRILLVELGILAVATFAAIGTDSYWSD